MANRNTATEKAMHKAYVSGVEYGIKSVISQIKSEIIQPFSRPQEGQSKKRSKK